MNSADRMASASISGRTSDESDMASPARTVATIANSQLLDRSRARHKINPATSAAMPPLKSRSVQSGRRVPMR